MRKLALLPAIALIAVVPPSSAAPELSDSHTADPLLTTDPFEAAFSEHEARAKVRIARARARRAALPEPVAVPAHLQAIAQCESGGDPGAIGGGGLYRGKYQFSVATWQAVGGTGDPAAAPEAEQDRRAIILYNQSGPGQWPVCGS